MHVPTQINNSAESVEHIVISDALGISDPTMVAKRQMLLKQQQKFAPKIIKGPSPVREVAPGTNTRLVSIIMNVTGNITGLILIETS